jgi:outer membrane protein OmpA-like peptidoglycan-associated protein
MTAGMALALTAGLGVTTPATAQSTPNVIVDLSVLGGPSGYAPYPPPAYGTPQPYGQGAQPYGVPQPYGAPQPYGQAVQPYGQPVPSYGVPQPYGQAAQPYGGQLPYGQAAQPYGGQQANIQPIPAYGGYLIMPNTGYGPPQPTMLPSPPAFARAPAPPTMTAQRPARRAPINITPDPPARPKISTSEVAAIDAPVAKPVEVASPAVSAAAPEAPAPGTAALVRSAPKPAPVSVRVAAAPPPKAAPTAAPTPPAPIAEPAAPTTATIVPRAVTAPAVNAPTPTVTPAPPVAVVVTPSTPPAEKVQVAARTPSGASGGGKDLAIPFDSDSAELEDSSHSDLDGIAAKLVDDDSLRVRLVAYAEGDDDEASKARRLSLSRALAVRGYLIKQGIRSTRMDVRALGNKVEGGPSDRVDVMVVTR